jgi:aminopeptidase
MADAEHGAGRGHEHGGFENLYFDVCTMDYRKDGQGHGAARAAHGAGRPCGDQGAGHRPAFSIKGIGAKMCKGDRNIPDGEVFSCPVRDSIEG